MSSEVKRWAEQLLGFELVDGFGSTECAMILTNGKVQRPPVTHYKLLDVPELGYYVTDKPHPRGELLLKSSHLFVGYYKQPELTGRVIDSEGFFRTGDIMAETAPEHLRYLDRRNFVVKLAQGEFVAVSKLEAEFVDNQLIQQIYIYGNSQRSCLVAVVVPAACHRSVSAARSPSDDDEQLKSLLMRRLQSIAREKGFKPYEVPQDCIVERSPFTTENGLLTGAGKMARPRLLERYQDRLEQLYLALAARATLADSFPNIPGGALHGDAGENLPVLETVRRAAAAFCEGVPGDDAHFTDFGGDSLAAVTFSNTLRDLLGVEVPVSFLLNPTVDLQALAVFIEAQRTTTTTTTTTMASDASSDDHDASSDDHDASNILNTSKILNTSDASDAPPGRVKLQPTAAVVHPRILTELAASDLTLQRFGLDPAVGIIIAADAASASASLEAAASSSSSSSSSSAIIHPLTAGSNGQTILLTGATGFLGRYLVLEWLKRFGGVSGCKLICLVRGSTGNANYSSSAQRRLEQTLAQMRVGPEAISTTNWSSSSLEVLPGDQAEPYLGLDAATWQRLATTVDLIVDAAALVNHLLPYDQLFGPNVVGTAELIRLALSWKQKRFAFISSIVVGDQVESPLVEDADIRVVCPTRKVDESRYANGYANSKWASEVLLREANERCGLPVIVFRCGMILAEPHCVGQLNLPDVLTRLILSVLATGVAPDSFYELGVDGRRQPVPFGGLPVDFVASAVWTLCGQVVTPTAGESHGTRDFAKTCEDVTTTSGFRTKTSGFSKKTSAFRTYHVFNPNDDGGLDEYVDCLIAAGYEIQRIPEYGSWFAQFVTALRALPDRQRRLSVLPLLQEYKQPRKPLREAVAAPQFEAALRETKLATAIPHVKSEIILKYATDLRFLDLF